MSRRRPPRTFRRTDFEDPKTAPVTRIDLTHAQRLLLLAAAAAEKDGIPIIGNAWQSADVLTDWGFVEQYMRGGLFGRAYLRITARGRRWLRYAPKGMRDLSS